MARLARTRQGAYRLFSKLLMYPDYERMADTSLIAAEIVENEPKWISVASPVWDQLLHQLMGLGEEDATALQGEYISTFSVNRLGIPCPIYESAYVDKSASAVAWLLTQLEREYAEMGLSMSPDMVEPADHASVQLEYMSFLCGREADTLEDDSSGDFERVAERQKRFIETHLTNWFPEFCKKVEESDCGEVLNTSITVTNDFLVQESLYMIRA